MCGLLFRFFVPAKAYQHSKRMFPGTKTALVGWSLKHQEHENTETMKSSNETNIKQYLRVNLAIAMITRNNKIIPEIILQTNNLLFKIFFLQFYFSFLCSARSHKQSSQDTS